MCIGCIATVLGIIMNLMGLRSNDLHKKFVFYKTATYLTFLAGKFLEVNFISVLHFFEENVVFHIKIDFKN